MNTKKLLVCIPTYNEIENIKWIVGEIEKNLPTAHILIVDDNSPDGTGQVADLLASQSSLVHVLHRSCKEGLGKAHGAAFLWGINHGYDYFIQFDADGSHNPMYLVEMARRLEDSQMVVASRLVPGGGSENWGIGRRALSAIGNLYARKMLPLPIKDLTSGFNGFHRSLLMQVDFQNMFSSGYAFQIELKHQCVEANGTIDEMPIVFKPRRGGSSKMSAMIVAEALLTVFRLRFRK